MLFYEGLVPSKSCSCRCCFSVVPKSQKQSWGLLQNRAFWSCCLLSHYSSKRRNIWLERNFTKTFVLTQCQHGITQTRVILPELVKPCSHPKIMLMVQHKTAASYQSSVQLYIYNRLFSDYTILTAYNLCAAVCSSYIACFCPIT